MLIADARAMAADAMARVVNRGAGLTLVGKCANRTDVATVCIEAQPDVAVIDLRLYNDDAGYATSAVHEHAPRTRILLVAHRLDEEQLAKALVARAANCISAYADTHEFVAAVRATALGQSILASDVHQRVLRRMMEFGGARELQLSPREREVLRLLAADVSMQEIASQLFITLNTVRTHLYRSYRKLGTSNRAGAIGLAMRRGLLR